MLFSSILSVAEKNVKKNSHLINMWLKDWCHQWNFGFFAHGVFYMVPGLLERDRVCLFKRGKRILACELAGQTESVLNQV